MDEYIRDEKEQERRRLVRLEMKRKHARQQRIALGVIAALLLLIIILVARGCSNKAAKTKADKALQAANATIPTAVTGTKATIAAVGDIMCYDEQILDALQEDGTYNFDPSFAAIKPYLEGANLTVGNLELNFCGAEAGYAGKPKFNAPEALAGTLHNVGFDILQTANTYSLTNDLNGLTSTIRYLTENKIDHVGTYHNEAAKAKDQGVLIKNVNGIRFAFISYTKGMNNLTLPENAQYSVDVLYKDYNSTYAEINEEALLASVKAAKTLEADVIIAMLHWGSEYEVEPNASQNEIANLLFNNGVDVILGSHSHEVGPMETRTVTVDGKEKTVFIAYSLGNFFSSMDTNTSRTSAILNLEFMKDSATGKTTITGANYLPVYIVDSGEKATVRYEVLPVRSALNSSAFPEFTNDFNQAIITLQNNTKSKLDSGT